MTHSKSTLPGSLAPPPPAQPTGRIHGPGLLAAVHFIEIAIKSNLQNSLLANSGDLVHRWRINTDITERKVIADLMNSAERGISYLTVSKLLRSIVNGMREHWISVIMDPWLFIAVPFSTSFGSFPIMYTT